MYAFLLHHLLFIKVSLWRKSVSPASLESFGQRKLHQEMLSLSFNIKTAASDYTDLFVQISGVLCSLRGEYRGNIDSLRG